MLDLLITGGTVVDGSGRGGVRADVGIRDGRVVAIGTADEPAARHIDADGLVVAPGFVDVHAHYDAQVFWDTALAPSSLHGVTTALSGNCGFTLAPMAEEHADYVVRMLAVVEGMPLESLQQSVPVGTWRTFADWLGLLDGALAINTGFMAGHSTIRRLVMGDDAHDPHPGDHHLEAMERLLRDALAAGALGFSTSNGKSHFDGESNPVPSRCAPHSERIRLAAVVRDFPGASLQCTPFSGPVGDDEWMIAMSQAGDRPINWNVFVVTSARKEAVDAELAVSDRAVALGARVVALENPSPLVSRRSFHHTFGLDAIPDWGPVCALPHAARRKALADPQVRRVMRAGAARGDRRYAELLEFATYTVEETFAPANEGLTGRLVGDIARERGADPFDTLLDIVVADDLRTTLRVAEVGCDDESIRMRAAAWRDPRVVLGASDAGAHLDMLTTFVYPTDLLGRSVRERQLLGLEEAVRLLTDVPARLYGLRDRGRVALGWHADLVVFDPATVAPGPVVTVHDLPGGAPRLHAGAAGIEHLVVNGTEVSRAGRDTGDRPGRVLRSGVDTADVRP
jgi:N-acyl-D-aspartate/D-glutamate deacylase